MGDHIDIRAPKRKKVKEHDEAARHRRASFKQYLRELEENLLEDDLNIEDQDEDQDEDQVQAHDDKREEAQRAGNGGKDWRDGENWHSRMQGKMKTHSEAELRYIIKDARTAAKLAYERGNNKKGGQYEDEAHYAAQELHKRGEGVRAAKRAYDNEKAEKPPGIWEDEKQRDRMRDDAVRDEDQDD